MARREIEIEVGDEFDQWTVKAPARKRGTFSYWKCECSCGTVKEVSGHNLVGHKTKSCGCYRKGRFSVRTDTMGLWKTPEYAAWRAALDRCTKPNNPGWKYYGGRGIKMCKRWQGRKGFANFLKDMGSRPDGLTLERKKTELGYTPGNCCWDTRQQQTRNKRNCVFLVFRGEKKNASTWAEILDVPARVICDLKRHGWSDARIYRALTSR